MNKNSQRGNALWFILIAIVLLGALTVLLTRSGTNVNQTGDVEQARIKSGQVMRWAKGVQSAIEQMKLRGVSESDISFENDDTTVNYTNANCTTNECKVFANGGGGQTYLKPPTGANDGSEWIFTGATNVGTVDYPVGSTAAKSGNDLIALLPNANETMCIQINRDLDIGTGGTIPADETGIDATPFVGTYGSSLVVLDGDATPFEFDGKQAGCFADGKGTPSSSDDEFFFYYVLLAR